MKLLLKNSKGQPSTSVTFAWVAFIFCLFCIVLGLVEEITLGDKTFKFNMIGSDIIIALLGPAFGLYGFGKWAKVKEKAIEYSISEEEKDLLMK